MAKIIERRRIMRKDGETLTSFYSRLCDLAIKIAEENGVLTWISFMYDDVTEKKRYEQAEICFIRR